jgi:hypothetical protein
MQRESHCSEPLPNKACQAESSQSAKQESQDHHCLVAARQAWLQAPFQIHLLIPVMFSGFWIDHLKGQPI